jgi:hypothetical protein
MTLCRRSTAPLPTPQQSRRAADVVRSACRHFGEPGAVIAFLNPHDVVEGLPLHLAIESDAGLERVERLPEQLKLKTSPDVPCGSSKTWDLVKPSGETSSCTAPDRAVQEGSNVCFGQERT